MRNRRRRLLVILAVATGAALLAGYVPLTYPSTMSVCELIEERQRVTDRWASPHRGAVIAVKGVLYGGPPGMYVLECSCRGLHPLIGVSKPLSWLPAAPAWKQLGHADWAGTDKAAAVEMIARVESEDQGCFSPGMVIKPLVARFTTPVRTTARRNRPST
jgi:hypothetical protein